MTPAEQWTLVVIILFGIFIIRDDIRQRRRGKVPGAEAKSRYQPTPIEGRMELAYEGQRGFGWIQPGGPGVLRPEQVTAVLARGGWRGDFWTRMEPAHADLSPIRYIEVNAEKQLTGVIREERRVLWQR